MAKYRKTELSLNERAKIVGAERKLAKLIPIIMSCIVVLCSLVYVVSVMYSKFGDFTVAIQKFNYVEYGLSLSERRDFNNPTSSLNCKATEIITNIDGASLDKVDLGAIDGNDSDENYLCYTFYLRNSGTEAVSFDYIVFIDEMTMDIETAVRIRLISGIVDPSNGYKYVDREAVDYARVSSTQDENGNFLPEPGTTEFVSKTTVCDKKVDAFKTGDIMKFTVVIWLEGNDPECVDDIIGGEFKIGMNFKINGGAEEE